MSALVSKEEFAEVLSLIQQGRHNAVRAVNIALVETYWGIGALLSRKVSEAAWGKGIIKSLAEWLKQEAPDLKGFSAQNLWRMKQFYETYQADPKLSAVLRVLPWTHHCILLVKALLREKLHEWRTMLGRKANELEERKS